MKFTAAAVTSVVLAAFANAQNSTNATSPQLGIEAIEAHFANAHLVPDLLATFDPVAVMALSYDGVGDISPGQQLTKTQVSPTPSLTLTPANSTVKFEGTYTLVMADADVVGHDESEQTRHWLVNGVTVTNNAVSTDAGTAITKYAGPAPAEGSGSHRYVILLYTQPTSFTAPEGLNTPDVGVSTFNLGEYVKNSGLGSLVAGTYINVQEGTPTASVSATSAVVTSTLPAAQSSAASSSGSASGSASAASGSASSTSGNNNGAGFTVVPIVSVVLAAVSGFVFFL